MASQLFMTLQDMTSVQGFLQVSTKRIQHLFPPLFYDKDLISQNHILTLNISFSFLHQFLPHRWCLRTYKSNHIFSSQHHHEMRADKKTSFQFLGSQPIVSMTVFQISFCSTFSCLSKSGQIFSLLTPLNLPFILTLSHNCFTQSKCQSFSQTPTHHWKSAFLFSSHSTKLQRTSSTKSSISSPPDLSYTSLTQDS